MLRYANATDDDIKIRNFIKFVDVDTILKYKEVIDLLENFFKDSFNNANLKKAVNQIIEKTFNLDKNKLNLCVRLLSNTDLYTIVHSFSVYNIFLEILCSFKYALRDEEFFNVFKNRGHNINFSTNSIQEYSVGALLHDIGKKKIPFDYIQKRDTLTNKEFDIMKKHPEFGVKILTEAGIDNMDILEIVGNHHPGYKYFKSDEISGLLSEICNIADVYDACRSHRPYKESFDYEITYKVLLREKERWGWNSYIFTYIVNNTIAKFEKEMKEVFNCG